MAEKRQKGNLVGIKMAVAATLAAALFVFAFSTCRAMFEDDSGSVSWWPSPGLAEGEPVYLPLDGSVTIDGMPIDEHTTFLDIAAHLDSFLTYELRIGEAEGERTEMALGDIVAQPVEGGSFYEIVCADRSSSATFVVSAQETGQTTLGECLVYAVSAESGSYPPEQSAAACSISVYGVSLGDDWRELVDALGEPCSMICGDNGGEARFEDARASAIAASYEDDGKTLCRFDVGLAIEGGTPMDKQNDEVARLARQSERREVDGSSVVTLLGYPVALGETRVAALAEYFPDLGDAAAEVSEIPEGGEVTLSFEVPGAELSVCAIAADTNSSNKIRCLNGVVIGVSYEPVSAAASASRQMTYLEYGYIQCGITTMYDLVENYGAPDIRFGDSYRYHVNVDGEYGVNNIEAKCSSNGGIAHYSVSMDEPPISKTSVPVAEKKSVSAIAHSARKTMKDISALPSRFLR